MTYRAKRCLGGCGRKVERGSWCPECWPARAGGTQGTVHVAFRAAVLSKDDYRCVQCGEDDVSKLEAHHLEPGNDDPATGETVCRRCHGQRVGRYGSG